MTDSVPAVLRTLARLTGAEQNLLVVLTTRARRLVHVISSTREPVGLVGEYLEHAAIPPTETAGVDPTDDWISWSGPGNPVRPAVELAQESSLDGGSSCRTSKRS